MELTIDVLTISFYNLKTIDCEITLKALSAILITIYGHNPQKVMIYLRKCKSVIELTIKASLTPLFKEVCYQIYYSLVFYIYIYICLYKVFIYLYIFLTILFIDCKLVGNSNQHFQGT